MMIMINLISDSSGRFLYRLTHCHSLQPRHRKLLAIKIKYDVILFFFDICFCSLKLCLLFVYVEEKEMQETNSIRFDSFYLDISCLLMM